MGDMPIGGRDSIPLGGEGVPVGDAVSVEELVGPGEAVPVGVAVQGESVPGGEAAQGEPVPAGTETVIEDDGAAAEEAGEVVAGEGAGEVVAGKGAGEVVAGDGVGDGAGAEGIGVGVMEPSPWTDGDDCTTSATTARESSCCGR